MSNISLFARWQSRERHKPFVIISYCGGT